MIAALLSAFRKDGREEAAVVGDCRGDISMRRDDRAKQADGRSAFAGVVSARAHVVEAFAEEGSVSRHDVSECAGVTDVQADDVSEQAEAVSVFRDERSRLGHVVHLSREDVSALADVGPLSSQDLSECRHDLRERGEDVSSRGHGRSERRGVLPERADVVSEERPNVSTCEQALSADRAVIYPGRAGLRHFQGVLPALAGTRKGHFDDARTMAWGLLRTPGNVVAMKFGLAAFVAGASGFIALSYEILWYRLYSFVSWGAPRTFGILLAAYLYGIAYGSYRAGLYCERTRDAPSRTAPLVVLGRLLFLASILSYIAAPVLAYIATATFFLFALGAVILATTVLGAVLPLLSHLAILPNDRAGARLSYLYLANIVGSASGSLLTGFVAMDLMSTRTIAVALGLAGLALSGLVFCASGLGPGKLASRGVELAGVSAAMVMASHPLFDQLYERLLYKKHFKPDVHFAEMVENRSGVISVTTDGRVWGGGAYDGAINTSIIEDENWIVRAYLVSALHPNPKRMLMIGLASGSWAEVLANAPGLEKFTIVEINRGYLGIIARHPEVSHILDNPKIEIIIDDGRRWLLAHPEAKFDAIVMNTSWHWRAHASDLLSKEFLELARLHMSPGGLLFYNATGSHDVYKTALAVYPYVLRVVNFAAASDSPFSVDKEVWKDVLEEYSLDGERIFDLSRGDHKAAFDKLVDLADSVRRPPENYGLEDRESLTKTMADGTIITDDNMACEWEVFFPDQF